MHASQGIIRVFFRVLLVGLVFLGRVQQELQKSSSLNILILIVSPTSLSFIGSRVATALITPLGYIIIGTTNI